MIANQISKHKHDFILYYQCFLALVAVGVFFTAADIYWFDSGITPAPYVLVLALGLAAMPLVPSFMSNNHKYFPYPLFKWCVFYIIFSLIYYFLTIENSVINQELDDRILSVIFLMVTSFIFAGGNKVINITRWGLFLAVFWNIYTYIAELLQPGIWQTLTTINPTGRPSGFYLDPNKAACALIFSMIFSIEMLPKKFRLAFCLVVMIGVFTTLSRGGTVSMLILIVLFFIKRIIPRYQLTYFIVGALLLVLNLAAFGEFLAYETTNLGVTNYDMQTRIATFTDPASRQASDDTSRLDVVVTSWEKYWESPLFGHGFGYVKIWGEILPHNMYLSYMLEHGILGAIILPLLVFSVQINACKEVKSMGLIFGFFISFWAIFSNTVLYDRETMTVFSLMAAMSQNSQFKKDNII